MSSCYEQNEIKKIKGIIIKKDDVAKCNPKRKYKYCNAALCRIPNN